MKNIKSKYIIYPAVLLIMVGIPILRYYASSPGINACVLEYVDSIQGDNYKGTMYDIEGVKHIEAKDSNLNEGLEEYKVGYSNGCLMASDNLFSDMNNTFYCTVTYMIKNLPVDEKYKQPFGILKSE